MVEIVATSVGSFEVGWGVSTDGSHWLEVDPDAGAALPGEEAEALASRLWRARWPDLGKLLANSRTQNRIFRDQLLPSLRDGDAVGVQQAAAELKPVGPAFNRMARSLGAQCAENPAPEG